MSKYANKRVGILALQGDYARHQHLLDMLEVDSVLVRLERDLARLDALIIPGGESTTMDIVMDRFNLRKPLITFGRSKPVFGTCAGMIMLASEIENNISNVTPLGLMDIGVDRNGYGRQVHSFEASIDSNLAGERYEMTATFIRAPRITRVGPGVTVLAKYENDPILVQQNNLLAASFHTELDDDTRLLTYFLDEVS
ncbi:MAG: pyridoxal 5'-phosphate synthase glutaminase subunit PdxT [candidate division Zixibacteria bacterium]|nr:pyridoxal 5'-phosphate synthase glutaminase subunit PdxT [candidate division Zixibacteria bacterium]